MKSIHVNSHTIPIRKLLPIVLLTASLALCASTIRAAENPGVLPPGSAPYGKTYSEWAAAWWQWAYSIPADQNPVLDTTGEFSQVGQDGPLFFLAGTFGTTAVRECTVPRGKGLLIPLLNQPWVQFPEDPPYTIDEIRAIIAPIVDNPTLTCTVDEQPINDLLSYREQSSVFSVTFPEGNVLGLAPGTYAPCVDDGYYVVLAPLKPGRHTIHFTAETADHAASLDVTYYLTVE